MAAWSHAHDAFIRERRGALVGYAYLLAGDRPTAEDLVHDAIIRTFSKGLRMPDATRAEAYVRRAILTQFLNGRRARSRARAKQHLLVLPDVPAADEGSDEADRVARALAQLSPRERACVVLRYYDCLSTDEAADRLGVSAGAVKRYLHDARARLRVLLDDEVPEPADGVPVGVPRGRSR